MTGIDLGAVTGATGDFSIADKIVHTGDTNTSIRFPAADTITAETGGSERLRITSDGKIGINEATPDAQLHVRGSGNSSGLTFLSEDSSGNNTFWIQDGGKVGVHYYPFAINRDSTDTIPSSTYFYVHSASPFAIKNNGAVVIGTDTAATNAEVTMVNYYGSQSPQLSLYATPGNVSRLTFGDTDDHDIGQMGYDNSDNSMFFATNATTRLSITSGGNVNIGSNDPSNPFTYLRFGASQYGAADIRPTNDGSHKVGLAFYTDGTQDTTINPTERVRISSAGDAILNIRLLLVTHMLVVKFFQ